MISLYRMRFDDISFNPYPAKIIYLKFKPLEVVSRYSDPQPQVVEKYNIGSVLDQMSRFLGFYIP